MIFLFFEQISSILKPLVPTVLIVAIFYLIYASIVYFIDLLTKKEMTNKKKINKEFDEVIKEYEIKNNLSANLNEKLKLLRYMSVYSNLPSEQVDEIREKGNNMVKKYKAKPFVIILSFIFKMAVFISVLLYFATWREMDKLQWLPFITAILSVSIPIARKRYIISLVLASIGLFFYQYFSTEALVLLAFRYIHTIILFIFNKKRKKEI